MVTTCFTLVSDYKQLDRLQDRISLTLISIRNFEATEKCQPWQEYIHYHWRRKGKGRRVTWRLPAFWNLIFSYYIFNKKGCLLSFEWKKWNFTIFAHSTKILGFTWKILLLTPPWIKFSDVHVHNVWLIMNSWWTIVLWSGTTKLYIGSPSNFGDICPEVFLWLTHRKLDCPENFWYNFRNWWGQLHPLATRLVTIALSSLSALKKPWFQE